MTKTARHEDDDALLEVFRRLPDPDARDQLTRRYLPLAEHLAGRFAGRGEAREDLVQVASLGLVHAIDRFDPDRGVQFPTFAAVTIVGELRRHFRDRGWSVRVPRGLQEAALLVNRTLASLWQELGRSPTVAEIAERADLPEETVLEAMDAVQAYSTASLDVPVGEEGAATTGDLIGSDDPGFEVSEEWLQIEPALLDLPERERRILYLRFFKDMTQTEIAQEIGISQMHVSRLLAQSLQRIRAGSGVETDPGDTDGSG
jgi:RNA polymerase sigma-B factor